MHAWLGTVFPLREPVSLQKAHCLLFFPRAQPPEWGHPCCDWRIMIAHFWAWMPGAFNLLWSSLSQTKLNQDDILVSTALDFLFFSRGSEIWKDIIGGIYHAKRQISGVLSEKTKGWKRQCNLQPSHVERFCVWLWASLSEQQTVILAALQYWS